MQLTVNSRYREIISQQNLRFARPHLLVPCPQDYLGMGCSVPIACPMRISVGKRVSRTFTTTSLKAVYVGHVLQKPDDHLDIPSRQLERCDDLMADHRAAGGTSSTRIYKRICLAGGCSDALPKQCEMEGPGGSLLLLLLIILLLLTFTTFLSLYALAFFR